jgi:hypothetical protein
MRGLPVITLGSSGFAGPFLAPLWTPPRAPGLYAVMIPGWRLLMFHPVYFGEAADLSAAGVVKGHASYADWLALAGTEWNLYIATLEMYQSSEAERQALQRSLAGVMPSTLRGPLHA